MDTWPEGTLEVAVLYQAEKPIGQPSVDWAVAALVAGHDTPSLRVLAGLDLEEMPRDSEARPLFASALSELHITLPDFATTGRLYVQHVAEGVVTGRISPRNAAVLIHNRVISPLNHPKDLMPWCYLWEGNAIDLTRQLSEEELDVEIRKLSLKTVKSAAQQPH